jgi:Protein of unknown function (DUF3179)
MANKTLPTPASRSRHPGPSRVAALWATLLLTCGASLALAASPAGNISTIEKLAQASLPNPKPSPHHNFLPLSVFTTAVDNDEAKALVALTRIEQNWHESSAALLIEMVYRVPNRRVLVKLVGIIEKASGVAFDGDVNAWYDWLWSTERAVHPDYAAFKSVLLAPIDPRFKEYFDNRPQALIRLDEIRWGGVRRDGIPPLKNPKMIAAKEATWLGDEHIVFGVAINGDVRAYPKRILAWHEMFKDRIGGLELAGVYCTLCGALVMYDVTSNGVQHELGTSGFLYRSNKLMYDHATKSMWSTLTGSPVMGPLVGKGIELKSLYVVTTTWKEWRTRHPGTTVLSLDTGHQRDYDEGVAYRDYFASDQLMFNAPKKDTRLPNKAEVLALRVPTLIGTPSVTPSGKPNADTLAISADFLSTRPVYALRMGNTNMVVLTDTSGANRVYEAKDTSFASWDSASTARDSQGGVWKMDEAQLTGPKGELLKRLPAHRAFWFGWHAAFPDTRLVK